MNSGAYLLIIFVNKSSKIRIGKLGTIFFKKGWYVYVGSAMNNLDARIERHLSIRKKIHWHIDYFLAKARIVDVIRKPSRKKQECILSRNILKLSNDSVFGFGCSDCICKSHLYYFKNRPMISD